MKKNNMSYGKIFNYICIVFMLLLIVTQFLPFWECPDCADGTASVSDYVWFPDNHKDITKGIMRDLYGKGFEVAQVILPNIVILAGCVLGIIFCIKDAGNALNAIIPFIAGVFGVFGYLFTPGLMAGQNWILHVIAGALVMACSAITLSEPILKLVKKLKANKQ